MIVQLWWGSKKHGTRRVCYIWLDDREKITEKDFQYEANQYCLEKGKGYTKLGFQSFIDYINQKGIKCNRQLLYQIHVSSKGKAFHDQKIT